MTRDDALTDLGEALARFVTARAVVAFPAEGDAQPPRGVLGVRREAARVDSQIGFGGQGGGEIEARGEKQDREKRG